VEDEDEEAPLAPLLDVFRAGGFFFGLGAPAVVVAFVGSGRKVSNTARE
jgi:hypothetical protein